MSATASAPASQAQTASGVAYALGAFGLWGVFPLYFHALASVPAVEVLAHRVVWSVLCVALALSAWRQWPAVRQALRERRTLLALFGSSLLIAANWLVFIWAVAQGRVLEASLGYYITPLVSVLFGRLFLHERLYRVQWLAVAFAAIGVGYMLLSLGALPWVSLALAASFSAYGLVRKVISVGAIPGLFLETLLLAPLALAYLGWLLVAGQSSMGGSTVTLDLLLLAAGVVTATPLLFYTQAVRRLRLASVGLFQYITPTAQMLLAVFVFQELFTVTHGVTFACIWLALALYSASAWQGRGSSGPSVRDT